MSWDEDDQETTFDEEEDPGGFLIDELEEAFAVCNGWSTKDE